MPAGGSILVRVVTPYYVAGVVFELFPDQYLEPRAIHSAPILRWMVGKQLHQLAHWCAKKNYEWEIVT